MVRACSIALLRDAYGRQPRSTNTQRKLNCLKSPLRSSDRSLDLGQTRRVGEEVASFIEGDRKGFSAEG